MQISFVEELLEFVKRDFVADVFPRLEKRDDVFLSLPQDYDLRFKALWNKWETGRKEQEGPKKMKTFAETAKGKESKGKKSKKKKKKDAEEEDESPGGPNSEPDDVVTDPVMAARAALRNRRSQTVRGPTKPLLQQESDGDDSPRGAAWNVTIKDKLTQKDLNQIDHSVGQGERNLEEEKARYLGGDDDKLAGFYDDDEPLDFKSLSTAQEKMKSLDLDQGGPRGLFGRISSAFANFTGNKELTEQDIRPVLKQLSDAMVDRNVAKEVADEISMSVMKQLLGKKTASFTSVDQTVQAALLEALEKILTPKRNIDVLKEALSAKQKGQVYSLVFIGVNGVGKSTSLSKMAYYLQKKGGLKVMLAGCDNFRSGAIEQLK